MKVHTGPTVAAVVIAVLVALPLAGFAQTEEMSGAFPFLSIDPSQLRTLKAAFLIQWQLLNGFGDVPALYYVGLAAAVVGALCIVFVQKAQDTRTIVAWLLIVIICLFAPYNSKLLFYPTVKKSDPEGMLVEADEACDSSGTFVACGFTPQLVMAHIGTTLQVVFDDLFRSASFRGLVDGALAGVALTNSEMLKTSGSWLGDANQYLGSCQNAAILPSEMTGNDGGAGTKPYTLASAFDRIADYYSSTARSGVEADFRAPPPAVVLDWQANRNDANYAAAVGALCDRVVGNNGGLGQIERCGENGSADRAQKSTTTLLDLAKQMNAKPDPGSVLFYLTGPENTGFGDAAGTARKTMSDCRMSTKSTLNSLKDGAVDFFGFGENVCAGHWEKAGWAYGQFDKKFEGLGGAYVNAEMTPDMVAMLRGMDRAPVKVREFTSGDKSFDTSGSCSQARGNALFNSLFDLKLVNRDVGELESIAAGTVFSRLRDKISGAESIPARWDYRDVTALNCGSLYYDISGGRNKVCATASDLLSVLNSEQFFSGAANEETKRQRLAELLVRSVMPSTAIYGESDEARETAEHSRMRPSVIGDVQNSKLPFTEQTTGGLIGSVIEWLGGGIVWIVSKFIGPFSIAVLNFCRIIIDMALAGAIVVTPFIMLIGVAIPQHAAGILIQVIGVVFILKLVPVVFIIIDNLAGIVYRTFGAIGGDDKSLKEGIFIFAIAGVYTQIVGMTLFLLFKIGDAKNLEALRQIDDGAKRLADAGKNAAIAVASFVGAGALGGVLGGAGAFASGKAGKDVVAAAGQAALDSVSDYVPGAVKGGAEAFNQGFQGNSPSSGGELPIDANGPPAVTEEGETISLDSWKDAQQQWSYMNGGAAPTSADDWLAVNQLAQSLEEGGGAISIDALGRAKAAFRSVTGKIDLDAADMTVVEEMAVALQLGVPEAEVRATMRGTVNAYHGTVAAGVAPLGGLPGVTGDVGHGIGRTGGRGTAGAFPQQGQANQPQGAGTAGQGGAVPAPAPTKPPTPMQAAKDRIDEEEKVIRDRLSKLDIRISNVDDIASALRGEMPRVVNAAADKLVAAEARNDGLGIPGRRPGVLQSAAAGAFGGMMAGGGLSKIPVVGDIIRNVLDEYYEAPERARAWQQAGGISNWMKARGDARRREFLEKEASTYGAGMQYQNMVTMGAMDGPWKVARKAAAEAAAKVRDERDAVRMVEAERGGRMLTGEDFRAATLANAIESLDRSLQNGALFKAGRVQVGADGKEVKLTPEVLKELVASKTTKALSSTVDELMLGHLYLDEKDGRQGTHARTRGDARAIAKFVREDIGTDYQIGAFAKMQQGKNSFYHQQGMVKRFREDLAVERVMLNRFKAQFPQATKAEIDAYKAKLPASRVFDNSLQSGYMQMALSGYRAKFMDHQADLKDQVAQLNQMEKQAKLFESKVGNILSMLKQYGQIAQVPQQNMDGLDDALQNVATSRHAKAVLSRVGMDASKKEYILQIFSEAGVDEKTVEHLRMIIG
ncbi:hypothetical protein [Filomicrobium sp.]|uniref:hypothetical protein n=1 Tax=Filomicrobium sp. TaxID=2024831 RepID=UPI00258A3E4E|nr:hypothetical protein [Filomicrobium sp.]MCV0371861.1 hypothetical protein [Filomicrobium sp.]